MSDEKKLNINNQSLDPEWSSLEVESQKFESELDALEAESELSPEVQTSAIGSSDTEAKMNSDSQSVSINETTARTAYEAYSHSNRPASPSNLVNPYAIPEEIKGWNWGAFMNNIMWGIGNKTYLPLFCLIPVFNFVWVFVCGAKGNEWAWRDGDYSYEDIETFKKIQATWNRAGLIQFILVCIFFVLYFLGIFFIAATLDSSATSF